jgi:hypothetical protein
MSKKKTASKKKVATKKAVVEPKTLVPEDLQRFINAQSAVVRANVDRGLILAGFEAMAVAIQTVYEIDGAFEINPQTGVITEVPEDTDVSA